MPLCFPPQVRPQLRTRAPSFIDPAFGDNGVLYPAFDQAYVNAMKSLIKSADIILPNLTEACFLSGVPYEQNADLQFTEKVIKKLATLTEIERIEFDPVFAPDVHNIARFVG